MLLQLKNLGFQRQDVLLRDHTRIEAVDLLLFVAQTIVVRVRVERVGRNQRGQRGALSVDRVDKLPTVDFLRVGQPIPIGIGSERIRAVKRFPIIVQPIVIGIRPVGIGAGLDFVKVGQAVPIAIGSRVIGIVATGGFAAQAIPIGIDQRGETCIPGQGNTVIAPMRKGHKLIQGGGEHVKFELCSQVNVQGLMLRAQATVCTHTFLHRDSVALGQKERRTLIQAGFSKRHVIMIVDRLLDLKPSPVYDALRYVGPIIVHLPQLQGAVNILVVGGDQLIAEGRTA